MSNNEKSVEGKTKPEVETPSTAVVHVTTPRFNKKTVVRAAIAIVVIVVLIVCFIWYRHDHNKQRAAAAAANACITGTNEATLKQAYVAVEARNVVTEKQLIDQLKAIPNYQKDPDCLYPIVMYYINIADAKNATTYVNQLAAVYNPKKGYGYFPGYAVNSIATLKQEIAAVKVQAQQSKSNVETFGNAP